MNEKRLYEAVEATGETLNGTLHILDTNDQYPEHENNGSFRVYHTNGYCFDVTKEYVCDPEEVKDCGIAYVDVDGFIYEFYSEWEGFKNDLTIESAFKLIQSNSHLCIKE